MGDVTAACSTLDRYDLVVDALGYAVIVVGQLLWQLGFRHVVPCGCSSLTWISWDCMSSLTSEAVDGAVRPSG